MNPAPIALFVYNRPDHTTRTLEALQKNHLASESELIIFSDGPKDASVKTSVDEVRTYLKSLSGFKKVEIREAAVNKGLSGSIISGVTEIVGSYGRVIVLEDDLVTSPHFLTYMNDALDLYERDGRVASIHGYVYPVKSPLPETFFLRGADCWGWATWKRGWNNFELDGGKLLAELEGKNLTRAFDFDGQYPYTDMLKKQIAGKNNSWAIRWYASAFVKDMLTLYPGRSLVKNIGHDKTGVHGTQSRFYATEVTEEKIRLEKLSAQEDIEARRIIVNYFRSLKPPVWKRAIRKVKSWV